MAKMMRRVDTDWTRRRVGDVDMETNLFFASTGCALTVIFTSPQLTRLNAGHALVAVAVNQPTTFEHVVTLAANVDPAAVHALINAHPLMVPIGSGDGAWLLDSYSVSLAKQVYTPTNVLHIDPDVYKKLVGEVGAKIVGEVDVVADTVAEYHQRLLTVPVVYATAERVLNAVWCDWQRVTFDYRTVATLCGNCA